MQRTCLFLIIKYHQGYEVLCSGQKQKVLKRKALIIWPQTFNNKTHWWE